MTNNIILIALLTSITFPVNALTKIETQEARIDHLNNLRYEIKDMKLRVQRAELQKRCQENNGCLDIDSPIVVNKKPKESVEEVSAVKRMTVPNSRYTNGLSINAIIDNRVVFQGVDGFYGAGDFLSHDIKIKSIEGSKVTLIVTGNNTEKTKTINIDWITD
jgi:hypothetical protein